MTADGRQPDVRLTLRPLPARYGDAPPVVRLRRLLNTMGCAFGFKALAIEEVLPDGEKSPRCGSQEPAPNPEELAGAVKTVDLQGPIGPTSPAVHGGAIAGSPAVHARRGPRRYKPTVR